MTSQYSESWQDIVILHDNFATSINGLLPLTDQLPTNVIIIWPFDAFAVGPILKYMIGDL